MQSRVRKAVFPVGGLGTRFLPATKCVAKELLPVVDKPLIQYAVEEAQAAGIEEFIFVTSRGKNALEDHFDHAYELRDTLLSRGKKAELALVESWLPEPGHMIYTRQMEPQGLGHAVWCARSIVGNEPFAVILADDMILSAEGCLSEMMTAYEEVGGNLVAVMDVPLEHTSRYGVVAPGRDAGGLVEVKGMVEKPDPAAAPSRSAVIGRYILQPEVFDHLARGERGAGNEIQLTDAMVHLIGKQPFHGVRFTGQRFDCGDKIGFLQANLVYALERADLKDDVARFIKAMAKEL